MKVNDFRTLTVSIKIAKIACWTLLQSRVHSYFTNISGICLKSVSPNENILILKVFIVFVLHSVESSIFVPALV